MLGRVSPACELIYNAKLSLKKKETKNKQNYWGQENLDPYVWQ